MKKNNILIIALLFNASLFSCSQSQHEDLKNENVVNEEVELSTGTKKIKSTVQTRKVFIKNSEDVVRSNNKTIFFNEEKYLYNGDKLQKGSQVRSFNSSEKAKVRGTFVIVTKTENITNASIKNKVKIATDTFRLTPNKTADLMVIYKKLLSNKSITKVELELIYSGKRNNAAEY